MLRYWTRNEETTIANLGCGLPVLSCCDPVGILAISGSFITG